MSLCTTCMNRLWQLQQTIVQNLQDNLCYPNFEYVLLDYNSNDDLEDWATFYLTKYAKMGVFKYYQTKIPKHFSAPHAKNIAHRCATGDIICNVDGDNFTGYGFCNFLNTMFNQDKNIVTEFVSEFDSESQSSVGRIAMTKSNFVRLGGYNEDFSGMGWQDFDLVDRAHAMGLKKVYVPDMYFRKVVEQDEVDKVFNLPSNNLTNIHEITHENAMKSKQNLKDGNLIANQGKEWGKAADLKRVL